MDTSYVADACINFSILNISLNAELCTHQYCSLQVGWKSASCKLQSLSKQFYY